jgi:3-hydroxyisobutyrate dehydrogenase
MLTGDFGSPSWELAMARKDARIIMEVAAHAELPLVLVPGVAAAMDRFIASGHGKSDWTIIAKDVV